MMRKVSAMGSSGKTFELLVQDLESLLQHAYGLRADQIQTKWRYRVIGKHSGQHREVDVALFVKAGSRTILIAVECRDRTGKQGLPWIEQLATKKRDIGADRMVAVSRDGFSRAAQHSAEANGIELHRLAERSEFNSEKHCAELTLTISRPRVKPLKLTWARCGCVLVPTDPLPRLTDEEVAELTREFDQDNWIDRHSGRRTSLKQIWKEAFTWDALLRDVAAGGPPVVQVVEAVMDRDRYLLDRQFPHDARLALASIRGEFELSWEPEVLTANRIVQYRSIDDEPLVELHEYDAAVCGLSGQTLFFASVALPPGVE